MDWSLDEKSRGRFGRLGKAEGGARKWLIWRRLCRGEKAVSEELYRFGEGGEACG
jgi:hypothetical protein